MTKTPKIGRAATFAVTGLSAAMVLAVAAGSATAAPTPAPTAKASAKPAPCTPEPGVDAKTIKVGAIFPKTGPAAPSFKGFDSAALLRFDQENAKGGVNGRKIVLIGYDDQGSAAAQTNAVNKALDQDGVYGFVSATTSDAMFANLKAKGIPITGLSNQIAYGSDRNAFGASGAFTPAYNNNATALRFKQVGATSVAMVNHATSGANTSNNGIQASLPSAGLKLAVRLSDLPQGAFDATSTALKLKNSGADAVYANVYVDGGVSLAQAFAQQGFKPKAFGIAGLVDPDVVAKAGSALEGAIGSTYGAVPATINKPSVRTYVNGMKAAGLNPYGAVAPMGYIAADLFIRGLREAGTCEKRADFITNLRKVNNFDGKGMLPAKISFQPGLTPNGDPATCSWFSQVKGGKLVADAKATCGQIVEVSSGKVVKG